MRIWEKKKIFNVFIIVCMIFTLVPTISVKAENEYTVEADKNTMWQSALDGVFTYDNGKMIIEGANLKGTSDSASVAENSKIKVTLIPNENSFVRTLRDCGQEVNLADGENGSKTYTVDAVNSNLSFEPAFDNNGGGGQNPPIENQDAIIVSFMMPRNDGEKGLTKLPYDILTNTFKGTKVEYSLDGGTTWKEPDGKMIINENEYKFDQNVQNVKLKVTFDDKNLYCQYTADGKGDYLTSQNNIIDINNKGNCEIVFEKPFRTVVWSNDKNAPEDEYVANGTVEIISADGVSSEDLKSSQNGTSGHVIINPGSNVTVRIKPDYGYQFLKSSLNGTVMIAESEVSTFTFIMPDTNLHLSALFEKCNDIVNISSKSVDAGTVENAGKAINSGNVKLDIKETDFSDEIKNKMKEKVYSSSEIKLYLDMELYNVINKGNKEESWQNKLQELSSPIAISLKIDEAFCDKDATYEVVRKHGDEYTLITAKYDEMTGCVSFDTDKFSDYALVVTSKKADEKLKDATTTTDTIAATATITATDTLTKDDKSNSGNKNNMIMMFTFIIGSLAVIFKLKKVRA